MTAISMLYTPNQGFIMAADGRAKADDPTASRDEETEEAQKIFLVATDNLRMAYSLAGFAVTEGRTFDVLAECQKEIRTLSPKRFSSGYDYVYKLCMNIKRVVGKARRDGIIDSFPTNQHLAIEERGRTFRLFFVGYFRGGPFWIEVGFYYDSATNRVRIRSNNREVGQQLVLCVGSEIISNWMYDPNAKPDPRFAKYKVAVPLEAGKELNYTTSFIRACSDPNAVEIDPICSSIGGHIHAAEVSRDSVRWLIEPKSSAAGATL